MEKKCSKIFNSFIKNFKLKSLPENGNSIKTKYVIHLQELLGGKKVSWQAYGLSTSLTPHTLSQWGQIQNLSAKNIYRQNCGLNKKKKTNVLLTKRSWFS